MGQCKKDVTPSLTHWSYVFLALSHKNDVIINIEEMFLYVFQIEPQSIAGKDGRIHEGDQILQVSQIFPYFEIYTTTEISTLVLIYLRKHRCWLAFLVSFLNTEMAQVAEIFPHGRQGIYKKNTAWSTPWLLMTPMDTQGARAYIDGLVQECVSNGVTSFLH